MIFDDRMRKVIEEHMAPSLEEQAAMYARESSSSPTGSDRTRIGRGGGGAALSRQASASELSRQQSDGMDAVIIQRLQQVRKCLFSAAFIYKVYYFTQTGSGQT